MNAEYVLTSPYHPEIAKEAAFVAAEIPILYLKTETPTLNDLWISYVVGDLEQSEASQQYYRLMQEHHPELFAAYTERENVNVPLFLAQVHMVDMEYPNKEVHPTLIVHSIKREGPFSYISTRSFNVSILFKEFQETFGFALTYEAFTIAASEYIEKRGLRKSDEHGIWITQDRNNFIISGDEILARGIIDRYFPMYRNGELNDLNIINARRRIESILYPESVQRGDLPQLSAIQYRLKKGSDNKWHLWTMGAYGNVPLELLLSGNGTLEKLDKINEIIGLLFEQGNFDMTIVAPDVYRLLWEDEGGAVAGNEKDGTSNGGGLSQASSRKDEGYSAGKNTTMVYSPTYTVDKDGTVTVELHPQVRDALTQVGHNNYDHLPALFMVRGAVDDERLLRLLIEEDNADRIPILIDASEAVIDACHYQYIFDSSVPFLSDVPTERGHQGPSNPVSPITPFGLYIGNSAHRSLHSRTPAVLQTSDKHHAFQSRVAHHDQSSISTASQAKDTEAILAQNTNTGSVSGTNSVTNFNQQQIALVHNGSTQLQRERPSTEVYEQDMHSDNGALSKQNKRTHGIKHVDRKQSVVSVMGVMHDDQEERHSGSFHRVHPVQSVSRSGVNREALSHRGFVVLDSSAVLASIQVTRYHGAKKKQPRYTGHQKTMVLHQIEPAEEVLRDVSSLDAYFRLLAA